MPASPDDRRPDDDDAPREGAGPIQPGEGSVPEPQEQPAPTDELGPIGLSAPREGAETLREADAAPDSPAEEDAERHAAEHEAETEKAAASTDAADKKRAAQSKSAAVLVAAGIFLSRIMGLVRSKAEAYFFGIGAHLDVYQLAMRGANLLQNLLGEGTISASFIPVYSRMLEEGRPEAAGRFAGAIFGLLTATAATLAAIGIFAAPYLVAVLAPGFLGDAEAVQAGEILVDRYALSVTALRITFPMAGVLVLSAWALGVLNSHRRFFLPYFAPVLWNASIVAALVYMATVVFESPFAIGQLDVIPAGALNRMLMAAVIGAAVGGVLQFAVQLPRVWKYIEGFKFSMSLNVEGVREAVKAFGPVVAGRGVYQLSGYLDVFIAGFLAAGAIGTLRMAQVLYILPISLFGMSVAASELPELSRISHDKLAEFLGRVERSLKQVLFMVIPTVVGYLAFGFLAVGLLFQGGAFDLDDTALVALVLGAYALGLGATAASRLLQNSFYALKDTKTPAKVAVARVAVSALIGAGAAFLLDAITIPDALGIPAEGRPLTLGAVGLGLGASAGAWVELLALARLLKKRTDAFHLPVARTMQLLGLALVAALPAGALWFFFPDGLPTWATAVAVLALYGLVYFGTALFLKFDEADAWLGRFLKRKKKTD